MLAPVVENAAWSGEPGGDRGHGIGGRACGVMIDTEPPMVGGPEVRAVEGDADRTVPKVAGSHRDRTRWLRGIDHVQVAGQVLPATKTLPAATSTPAPPVAPVQVPKTVPVLACTWTTLPK